MYFERVFTVRIVYKSGYTHDFRCTQFSYKDGTYMWSSVDNDNKPIDMGGSEIAAAWQLGYTWRLRFGTRKA